MPDTILSDLQRIQNTAARILTKCGDHNYPSINLLKKLQYGMVWYGNILFDIVHNIIENILTKHKNI